MNTLITILTLGINKIAKFLKEDRKFKEDFYSFKEEYKQDKMLSSKDRIKKIYFRVKEQKYITHNELQDVLELNDQYVKAGGNGYIKELIETIIELERRGG